MILPVASCKPLREIMFNEDASVTRLCFELRQGAADAATDLWRICCRGLVREARNQLGTQKRRIADEEDVALAVFHELCDAVSDGRFGNDLHRDDLIRLLRHFTRHEVLDQRRHDLRARRGRGQVRGDSIFASQPGDNEMNAGFQTIPSNEPSPELLVQLDDQLERLLNSLADDTLRAVAKSCLAGDTRQETADKLGLSIRSVERKVALIRDAWKEALSLDD